MTYGPFTRQFPRQPIKPSLINSHSDAIESIGSAIIRIDPGTSGEDGQVLGWVGTPGVPGWVDAGGGGVSRLYDVQSYGAIPDDSTDATSAFQDAIDAAISDGGGTVFFEGKYRISGRLEITDDDDTVTGLWIIGGGQGSKLTQTAHDTPHFFVDGDNLHSIVIGDMEATWTSTHDSTDVNANFIECGAGTGSKSLYNSVMRNVTMSNGNRAINSDGLLVWGFRMQNITMSQMYGGVYSLDGTAGQPNVYLEGVYINASDSVGPIYDGNALVATFVGCEINQANQGPVILKDNGGGDYTFLGELSIEEGVWNSANIQLFQVPTSFMRADVIKIVGSATLPIRIFYTLGGIIEVDLLRLGVLPSGSGHVWFWHVGESSPSDIQDPLKYLGNGLIIIGKVRFYDDLADGSGIDGYWRTTNYVAPNDMGSTAGADGGRILEWLDAGRIDYAGNANYTIIPGSPGHVIFNTTLTANRDVYLPNSDFMFSGMKVRVSKNVTGGDVLVKSSSGSTTYYTIPSATKGWIELTYNRSIEGGPSLAWSITGGGTWT